MSLDELAAFVAVARAGSFTRAAARMGVSQSALSQTLRRLEDRLGLRLLTRTTRRISATEAGERLLRTVEPRLSEIEAEVAALTDLRDRPSGTVRVSAGEHASETVLWPALERFLPRHPDVHVEVIVDNGLTDIVADRLDAGVRLGEQVAKDMVAVRVGPDVRMVVVGSPDYLRHRRPPAEPEQLTDHPCINHRLPTAGGIYAWELEKDGRQIRARVDGQLTVNTGALAVKAALAGLGLAFLQEDRIRAELDDGRLVRVLDEWCPSFPGFHLYYPNRRQPTAAFSALVEALRYRG